MVADGWWKRGWVIRRHNNSEHVCDVMLRINYEFKSGWQRKGWKDKEIVESIKMDLRECRQLLSISHYVIFLPSFAAIIVPALSSHSHLIASYLFGASIELSWGEYRPYIKLAVFPTFSFYFFFQHKLFFQHKISRKSLSSFFIISSSQPLSSYIRTSFYDFSFFVVLVFVPRPLLWLCRYHYHHIYPYLCTMSSLNMVYSSSVPPLKIN